MKKPTKRDMMDLIEHWRACVPKRPLTYGESLYHAREQAYQVRAFADENTPALDVEWLFEQTAIPVSQVPSYLLNENSGLTTDEPDGQLQIFINENEPQVRRRYSILHEWKHALDYYAHPILYRRLGRDEQSQSDLIEAIANDFAAHVLMPTEIVKHVWFDKQDIAAAANTFNVSYEAMRARLEKLGFIKAFWRATSPIHDNDSAYAACAV